MASIIILFLYYSLYDHFDKDFKKFLKKIRNDLRFSSSPALTNPLVLYSVPKCGPLRLRKVCKRGRSGRNWGRVRALLMMMVPKECPMKLTFVGFRPDVSMWWRISATNRSVIVSKSEKVSPFSTNVKIIRNNSFSRGKKNYLYKSMRKRHKSNILTLQNNISIVLQSFLSKAIMKSFRNLPPPLCLLLQPF